MAVFNNNLLAAAGAQSGTTTYAIDQSIRFNEADSPYMQKTYSGDGSRTTWSFSFWTKLGKSPPYNTTRGNFLIVYNTTSGAQEDIRIEGSNQQLQWFTHNDGGTGTLADLKTTQYLRDHSAWYHILCVADRTNAVASERQRMYINGQRVTDFATETYPSKDAEGHVGKSADVHYIGSRAGNSNTRIDGYMAEINYLDGLAYDPSFFGEFNDSGIWVPKEYTGSYGTNGFYIKGQLAGATNAITALGNIQHSTAQAKIGSSSILFDGNGDLLEVGGTSNWYDFGADGNPWTMEAYVRFDTVSITQKLFWQNNTYIGIEYVTGSGIKVRLNNGGINFTASWSPSINTWYHVAVVRETNNTTTVYIDGTSIGSGTISGGSSSQHKVEIGAFSPSTDEFDGYMDEIRISSVARFTSSFTPTTSEYASDGDTLALIHSNTTNGSTVFKNDVGFGNDSSGNQNNFATSGLAAHDQVLDSPTNNFAVANPLHATAYMGSETFSEGNLQFTFGSSVGGLATIAVTSGKWYVEWEVHGSASPAFYLFGIYGDEPVATTRYVGYEANSYGYYAYNGTYWNNNVGTSYGDSFGAGDIIGMALDLDNNKLYFSKNGTFQNSGDPTSGSTGTGAISIASASSVPLGQYFIASSSGDSTPSNHSVNYNFGQEGTFAGNVTAGGNSDANGVGNFKYSVPSGYLALCTKNLGS